LQSQTVIREKLRETRLYEKAVCEMSVKLTLGDHFTNILQAAFTRAEVQKRLTA